MKPWPENDTLKLNKNTSEKDARENKQVKRSHTENHVLVFLCPLSYVNHSSLDIHTLDEQVL